MESLEPPLLTVTVCPRPDGGTRLYLVGRLDAECVHHVESALTDARTRGGQVLVDLSRVEFLDCSGLGLLLRARLRNALLRLTAPSPVVRRVFAMALPVSVLDLWEAPP